MLIYAVSYLLFSFINTCISTLLFQAIGEKAEDETGLDVNNIVALMRQLELSRNQAVRALRKTNGDLIDALLNGGE